MEIYLSTEYSIIVPDKKHIENLYNIVKRQNTDVKWNNISIEDMTYKLQPKNVILLSTDMIIPFDLLYKKYITPENNTSTYLKIYVPNKGIFCDILSTPINNNLKIGEKVVFISDNIANNDPLTPYHYGMRDGQNIY